MEGGDRLDRNGIDGKYKLTLADGTDGQVKVIVHVTDGGSGVLTPTNFGSGSTVTFTAVGDTATLLFTNSKWYALSVVGATVA